jgi:hypothetical protein
VCTAAGVPLPTIFLADRDLSNEAPPVPGMGEIRCQPLSTYAGAGMLRRAWSLFKWVAEHPFEE